MDGEHKKYPELIGVAPEKQLLKLPKRKAMKCPIRTKSCSRRRGGCGYRYKKGDKTWVCPKCGSDRRCGTDTIRKKKTCRMHGASGGRPPGRDAKYIVSKGIEIAFNRIMGSPNILDLSEEIGMVTARNDELNRLLDDFDLSHSFDQLERDIKDIKDAVFVGEHEKIIEVAKGFLDNIEPLRAHKLIWDEIRENNKLLTSMMAVMHKWQMETKMMVAAADVVEWLAHIARTFIKYLPNAQDRKRFSDEIRGYTNSGDREE